jgi:hypothetical protein
VAGPRIHGLSLNGSRWFSDLRLRLKTRSGISRSNLGRRSRHGRLTVAPAGDGTTHRAVVPLLLLRRGSPRTTVSLLQRDLALRGRRGTVNSPRGILGSGENRSSAHNGVPFFLKLGNGEGILRWSSNSSKTSSSFPMVSSSSSWTSIAVSGGGIWCVTAAARAKAASQFGSKICTI